jgi:hypothetical protein
LFFSWYGNCKSKGRNIFDQLTTCQVDNCEQNQNEKPVQILIISGILVVMREKEGAKNSR